MLMSWMQMQWSAAQMHWVHEISQSALAVAVATLGVVILLELASIARLRRTVDVQMQRVFEQLDLLRGDNLQWMEAQQRPAAAPAKAAPAAAARSTGTAVAPYAPPALGAGEARLLAALTAARARLGRPEGNADAA
jgi:hypothetical protein